MLLPNIWLAWLGISDGRFVGPRIVTLCTTTVSSACVSSQLPPRSAARSTITLPGFIMVTASAVISSGDCRPGIAAVVITTSLSEANSAISSRCLPRNSSDCCLAYPPSSSASSESSCTSTNRAPILSTCSRQSGRTS